MKNIINKAVNLYYRFRYFKKHRQFSGYEKVLQKAIIKKDKEQMAREVEQIILKHRIVKYMRKFLKVDARSEYIPKDHKSREICRREVLNEFGNEMEKWGVRLKDDLTLCIL